MDIYKILDAISKNPLLLIVSGFLALVISHFTDDTLVEFAITAVAVLFVIYGITLLIAIG